LSWREDDTHFHLAWRELDGPPVSPPVRKGFGSRLIAMGLGSGRVQTEYLPQGFLLELSAPVSHLRQASM
jgi:two-component sensor histidine kinase